MKAISTWVPYATLLVVGAKKFETRTKPLPPAYEGQRVAIASTKTFGWEQRDLCRKPYVVKVLEEHGIVTRPAFLNLHLGHVVGTVRFVRCVPALVAREEIREGAGAPDEMKLGWYRYGFWAWEAEDPEIFETPVPVTGHRNWWEWDGPVLDDGDST